MARQPTRSALLLTTIAFGLFLNTTHTASVTQTQVQSDASLDEHIGAISNSDGRKFGDRIAPRHRPHVDDSSPWTVVLQNNRRYDERTVVANSSSNSLSNNVNSYSNSNHNLSARNGVNESESVTDAGDLSAVDVAYDGVDHQRDYQHHVNELKPSRINRYNSKRENVNGSVGSSHAVSSKNSDHDHDRRRQDGNDDGGDVVVVIADDGGDVTVTNVELPVISDNQLSDANGNASTHPSGMSSASKEKIAEAHRLEMSTEYFVVPSTASSSLITRSTTMRPGGIVLAAKTLSPPPSIPSSGNVTPPTIISTYPMGLRKEPWVVPVLVLATLAMIMMGAFEIFVLFKAWRTSPSRRHLFLGQMLLLGLFSCAGLAALLTASPTVFTCAVVRFGAGVAFALVFASLLVKCVFLISLNGGVYLPAPYQGLLLLFAVLIQVAVGGQWLLTSPPAVENYPVAARTGTTAVLSRHPLLLTAYDLPTVIPLCKTQFSELLFSLIYVVFLILFVAILAIKSRGIRDNYREATYIGLSIGGSIPIWLAWTLCGLAVAERHKDACLAFGLIATSSTVFLVMFMPKGRQLAAMGKEGLYVEDREEQFSSLSRAGSGYSPSFFHFKPVKYGMMGAVPTSTTTNTGNGTSSKHHQAVATLGGDRVALVAAAPPSYTRMYHYFPAHLTHPFCYYPPPLPPPPQALAPLTPLTHQQTPRYPGLFMRPDESNIYTTLEPTMSSNPNVYFQRSTGVHPGMMY